MTCGIHAAGQVELYFYGELSPDSRAELQTHLKQCAICRRTLDDLWLIRAALATRPDVATPPAGDWSGFMARLNEAIQREATEHADGLRAGPRGATSPHAPAGLVQPSARRRWIGYVAIAAMLAFVTSSAIVLFQYRESVRPPERVQGGAPPATGVLNVNMQADPALVSLSGSHFERSKLVLLELTTRDAADVPVDDWSRERELAETLLNDTRVYRLAAEQRGMTTLAGVMRDLELVLLQTSMSEQPDAASLDQLRRLIRRRDLLTKMNVVATAGP